MTRPRTEDTAAYAQGLKDGRVRNSSSESAYAAYKDRTRAEFQAVVKTDDDYHAYGIGQLDARIATIGQAAFEQETADQLRELQDKGYRL